VHLRIFPVGRVGNPRPIGNRPFQVRRPTAHTYHYFGRSTLDHLALTDATAVINSLNINRARKLL
jgi:hypothetical protein